LPAAIVADFVVLRAVPEAVEQSLAIPGYLTGAGEAGFVGTAETANAIAAIGPTHLAIAVGGADGYAGEVGIAFEA
jgi:hypothetical protein